MWALLANPLGRGGLPVQATMRQPRFFQLWSRAQPDMGPLICGAGGIWQAGQKKDGPTVEMAQSPLLSRLYSVFPFRSAPPFLFLFPLDTALITTPLGLVYAAYTPLYRICKGHSPTG